MLHPPHAKRAQIPTIYLCTQLTYLGHWSLRFDPRPTQAAPLEYVHSLSHVGCRNLDLRANAFAENQRYRVLVGAGRQTRKDRCRSRRSQSPETSLAGFAAPQLLSFTLRPSVVWSSGHVAILRDEAFRSLVMWQTSQSKTRIVAESSPQAEAFNQCRRRVEGRLSSCETVGGEGGRSSKVQSGRAEQEGFQLILKWHHLRSC